ncbi:helix-turn-helix transcriptional regulator [Kozakia baliensis]|uniref:helix-turn-helix transcriptional regulator n=1 Tax=Kozakia baliensis TaxID=153496 RepID=UPI0004971AD9|nr:helix-turn-helix transcriptional regulator [Kozakia baliensis]
MPNDFAQQVKALRATHHLTQSELATRLELSKTAIKSWELGYRKPSEATRAKLEALFATPAARASVGRPSKKQAAVHDAPKKSVVKTKTKPSAEAVSAPTAPEPIASPAQAPTAPEDKTSTRAEVVPARAQEMITIADSFLAWFRSKNIEPSASELIDLTKAAIASSR